MSKPLSNEVKQALEDIYYHERTGRGKEAFALLEKASAAGDGDATCILARCLCGRQYVWIGHRFPEDDDKALPQICGAGKCAWSIDRFALRRAYARTGKENAVCQFAGGV